MFWGIRWGPISHGASPYRDRRPRLPSAWAPLGPPSSSSSPLSWSPSSSSCYVGVAAGEWPPSIRNRRDLENRRADILWRLVQRASFPSGCPIWGDREGRFNSHGDVPNDRALGRGAGRRGRDDKFPR